MNCNCFSCRNNIKPTPIHASYLHAISPKSGVEYYGLAQIQQLFLKGYHDASNNTVDNKMYGGIYFKELAYTKGFNTLRNATSTILS